uniref:Retrotransposon gag domain-containing protein n=1 Tax=Cajanus cajan TaxID=3821 RepID=A0A151RJI6_CAJCA|nr:hypothetical protein KK1_035877 [Cajanus cajan]
MRVPLTTISFRGYAMYWWTSLERERRLHNDPLIQYWNELMSALRRRHIPSYYGRELMNKFQRLQQRTMSLKEYIQHMELYMMRAGIREEKNITISRFLSGLNVDIRDKVELLPYRDLNDLVQLCIKVEQQNLRKSSFKKESSYSNSYAKKDYKREGKIFEKRNNLNPSKGLKKGKEKEKGKYTSHTSTKSSEIKCFKCLGSDHIASQCHNKKVMTLRGQDICSSQDKATTFSSSKLFMIRRLLNNQPSDTSSQRENIFHTRCNISNKACSLIMDNGSWCNYCSTRMVDKLGLTTIPNPKPYQLHQLNDDDDMVVNQQVEVEFSIGNSKDKVTCDVVPMKAFHILLGRSWKFNKKTIHDGLTNKITFIHKGKKFVLHPLLPSQVVEDQAQMKIKR